MDGFKRSLAAGLVTFALALFSEGAVAAILFLGDRAGFPGEEVTFSLAAEAGTTIEKGIDIVPNPGQFRKIFKLIEVDPKPELTSNPKGDCAALGCSVTYDTLQSFLAQTELIRWRFLVLPDAADAADDEGVFNRFDIRVTIDDDPRIFVPEDREFRVLQVPEPSTAALLAVGLLSIVAVGARRIPARPWRPTA